jgi:glycosyltransferase involved in cell wall biosynthesis
MYKDIFRLVRELELEGRVHFSGYIPANDLPAVYNLAQAFVYPSNYEGFGFPPLEAMACGTPVITTAISAMLDNIGEAGLLVPPQDEEALTSALQSLLGDRAYQERLSQAGRQRAAEFTWERSAKETLGVYERAG